MTDDYKPLIIGGDYSRLLQCIDDLRALILPVVEAHEARQAENPPVMVPQDAEQGETLPVGEPQEVRPAKRTRTGLLWGLRILYNYAYMTYRYEIN